MSAEKDAVRAALLAARRQREPAARDDVATALRDHALAHPPVARATRLAAYLSMPTEPGTGPLLAALAERGTEVWVPVVAPDHALGWVRHEPSAPVVTTALGIPEPTAAATVGLADLGVDVVLVPALAVDHAGHRLGRGAGYYDRALVGVDAPLVAVVHADELLPEVPHEPHDVAVDAALTEQGVFRTRA